LGSIQGTFREHWGAFRDDDEYKPVWPRRFREYIGEHLEEHVGMPIGAVGLSTILILCTK
jgi:hypothetical protein